MDANDKLGNYFRKKLAEDRHSGEGWDRPSSDIRDHILEQIDGSVSSSVNKAGKKYFALFGAAVALLLLSNAWWYCHSQNLQKRLDAEITTAAEWTRKYQEERSDFEAFTNTTKNQIDELQAEVKDLNQRTALQESEISSWENQYAGLSAENRKLKMLLRHAEDELASAEKKRAVLNESKKSEDRHHTSTTALLPGLNGIVESTKGRSSLPAEFAITDVSPAEAAPARWQLGYRIGLQQMTMPVHRNLKFQRILGSKTSASQVRSSSHGLYLAYFLNDRWSLAGGISTAQFKIDQSIETEIWYDKKGEYINDKGERTNDFAYETTTPFAQTRGVITISVPDRLTTKDVLKLTLTDAYDIRLIQIPFSAQHHILRGQWNWILQAGMQWSRIRFKDYTFTSRLDYEGERISRSQSRVVSKDIPSQRLFNSFVGLGLEYSFYKSWNARLGMAYGFNYYKNADDKFLSTPKTNTNFEFIVSKKF